MNRTALLTFDYEVFLGSKTGSVENCVLIPTQKILNIFSRYQASGIFFVDAAWLLFLREHCPEDFENVSAQLREIISEGSSVELHLHPQWLDAEITGDHIRFRSISHYKLHSLEPGDRRNLFMQGVELLESITGKKLSCFRAGGWCIEPFESILPLFREAGICCDLSVVPGVAMQEGRNYDFDFTHVPNIRVYRFSSEASRKDPSGEFREVSLSSYNNNPLYRFINKILQVISRDKRFGDGVSMKEQSSSLRGSLIRRLLISNAALTVDNIHPLFFRFLILTHFRRENLIHLVSHPKTSSENSLRNIEFLAKNFETLNSDRLNKLVDTIIMLER